jgi:hypothetical protein
MSKRIVKVQYILQDKNLKRKDSKDYPVLVLELNITSLDPNATSAGTWTTPNKGRIKESSGTCKWGNGGTLMLGSGKFDKGVQLIGYLRDGGVFNGSGEALVATKWQTGDLKSGDRGLTWWDEEAEEWLKKNTPKPHR